MLCLAVIIIILYVLFVLPNVVKGLGLEFKERVLSGTCLVRPLWRRVIKGQEIFQFIRRTENINGNQNGTEPTGCDTALNERTEITTF